MLEGCQLADMTCLMIGGQYMPMRLQHRFETYLWRSFISIAEYQDG